VPACRHSFPPAKRRAGSSSIPTSLSPFNRVSRQHTVRLGQLSALPDPTPSLASSCFPWPLSIAAFHLPKSPCRMRHMEPTRRVAVDSLIPSVPLAANPHTGSACACCRAYSLHDIDSFLLPSVTPRVDSSATHPSHNQPCSTSSHHRSWPPAGHTAAPPPRPHTTLTGAPFRSTTVYTSAFPQSQSSSRFPSRLLSAYLPIHPSSQRPRSSSPFLFKVLLLCIPISSRTAFVVSQLPLLQSSVPMSWEHFVLLLPIAFNPLAVNGQKMLSLLLPKHYSLSLTHPSYTHTWGRLATCHPPDTSPPDQSDL
jgi:hypothetical protein